MIKIQINELLGDRSHYWLAKNSGIQYSVIRNLASQRSQNVRYSILQKLCDTLKCEPSDLIIKTPRN